jgi:transmembrane sensor
MGMLQSIFQQYGKKQTAEETKLVDAWYDAYDREADIVLTDEEAADMEQAMWQRLRIVTDETPRVRRIWWPYAAAAAAVILGVVLLWPVKQPEVIRYITYETGPGTQKQLQLPDGSALTLQAGSQLLVDEQFDQPQREIFMQRGEVSFNVATDNKRAFIVHAGRLNVTVLGTYFHIRSVSGVSKQEVVVQQGKVQVSQADKVLGTLSAGSRLVYDTLSGQATLQTYDEQTARRITQGWLVFENTAFPDLQVWLKARYGVTVNDPHHRLSKASLTTMFPPQTSATAIVEVLCAIHHVKYNVETNLITIL